MVMADKNSEELRNGRRSRGASPRSEDSSGGEDSDQGEDGEPYFFSPYNKACSHNSRKDQVCNDKKCLCLSRYNSEVNL